MNKLRNYFTLFFILLIFYFLFKYNYLLNISVTSAVKLWLNKIFPSLFIMFILSDIIINTNMLQGITKVFKKTFNRIFKTNGDAIDAFVLTIISCTPASAFIINEMLKQNRLDLTSANKLISYTFFSNPLFLYNSLITTFNHKTTFKIIVINYLANVFIGLFMRKQVREPLKRNYQSNNKKILTSIPNSIKKSMDTMFIILGTITFYMIVTNILIEVLPLNQNGIVIMKGIIEITQGLNILNTFTSNNLIKEIIALSIISFGGLSIHTQIYSLIYDTDISYKNFFYGRIKHVLISTIAYLLIP